MGWLNFGGKKRDRAQGFGDSSKTKSRKRPKSFILEKIVTPSAGFGDWEHEFDHLHQLLGSWSLSDLHLPNFLADSGVCPIDPSGPTNNLPPLIDFDPLGLQQQPLPPEAFNVQGAFDTLPPPLIVPIDPPGDETEPVVTPGDFSTVIKFTPEMGFLETPIEVSEGIWFLGGKSPEELNLRSSSSNLAAADTTNADQLWKGGTLGLNLDGSGVKVGVWDEGSVRGTHQEFTGRVSYGDSAVYNDHATHVAGTIGAAGVNADARGMANKVNIQSFDWNNDQEEMKTAAQNGISLSNHSYGNISGWTQGMFKWTGFGDVRIDTWFGDRGRFSENQDFGKYSGFSSSLDKVLYENPNFLSIWSSGNDRGETFNNVNKDNTYVSYFSQNPGIAGWKGVGWYRVPNSGVTFAPGLDGGLGGYDSLNPDHTAKNTLVVGAINPITKDPYTKSDASIASFSNLGLTDDGRLKVDVVADGIGVTSSTSASDSSYGTWNGTSMAAPNVTGTAALLAQHYQNLYGKTPLSATLKGTILHTAFDAGNVGPDYIYGWGVVDAAAAAQFLDNAKKQTSSRLIESTYSGSVETYPVTSNGIDPLKATIVWTDPAGTPHGNGLDETTSVLVNNLDIWITRPDGTKFYPWTLDPNNPSISAVRNKKNSLDNVEQVLIDAPVAGTYTINVGHSGASFNQNYSLLLSGLGVATIPKSTVSIATTDGSAAETKAGETPNPGKVTLTRSGGDNSKAETVYYTLSGTASNGVDYSGLSGTATFVAGQTSLDISINIVDDAIVEGTETLSISLMGNSKYSLGASTISTISIADNDAPPPANPIGKGSRAPNLFIDAYNRVNGQSRGIKAQGDAYRWGNGWTQRFLDTNNNEMLVMLEDAQSQAYVIWGEILKEYKIVGGPVGANLPGGGWAYLGYPRSDEKGGTSSKGSPLALQEFAGENGKARLYYHWNNGNRVATWGSVGAYYINIGGHNHWLGAPIKREYIDGDTIFADFEGGRIAFRIRDAKTETLQPGQKPSWR